jgi:hypothetical protein
MSTTSPSRQLPASAFGLGDHGARIAGDPPVLEARGDEPPLAAVERALAGEEPVAQDGPGGLEQPAPVEGGGVRDQHLRGEIRWPTEWTRCIPRRNVARAPGSRVSQVQRAPSSSGDMNAG